MINLNDVGQIKKYDSKNMAGSVDFLKDQVQSAWNESKAIEVPQNYKNIKNICLAGMGGSALGANIIRSVYDISVPFQIINDYTLPAFVNEDTLVITSSYSGTTEEVLSALKDAKSKNAKVVGISSGGVLIEELKKDNLPFYQFDTKYNPSGNPRLGLGFSIAGILGLFSSLGLVEVSEKQIKRIVSKIQEVNKKFSLETQISQNPAKKAAEEMMGKIFTIVAGPYLAGNAHTFANQTNESAKVFGNYFILSELNHHLLEGISNPPSLKETVKVFNLESDLYGEKIKIRMKLSNDLLDKNGIAHTSYKVQSQEKDLAAFEVLAFSSWTSYYMAILYEVDPNLIPNVDYFKAQLKKQ